jgi:hypothetical protein
VYIITTTGDLVLLHAHGVHADERLRVRELALKLLTDDVGIPTSSREAAHVLSGTSSSIAQDKAA